MSSEQAGRQQWSVEGYERNARFVSDLAHQVLRLLDAAPGERILDLGCGDGALTEKLAGHGAEIIGVDSSPEFVAAARERGIDAHLGDATQLTYDAEFDAVFSNAVLHWVDDHAAMLAGVHRALRANGRFVGEMGGHGNVAAIRVAIAAILARHGIDIRSVTPWYFPTADEYGKRLEHAGFDVVTIELHPRPTLLPTDMAGWLATFAEPFFAALPPAERPAATAETIALLAPALCDAHGNWTADYVRLRFSAVRRA